MSAYETEYLRDNLVGIRMFTFGSQRLMFVEKIKVIENRLLKFFCRHGVYIADDILNLHHEPNLVFAYDCANTGSYITNKLTNIW